MEIEILGPLNITTRKHRYFLEILDRFYKLTQVVPLLKVDAYVVEVSLKETATTKFVQHLLLKYGVPDNVLIDNGKKFDSELFQGVLQILGVSNRFTYTYHAQKTGQAERFNCTIQLNSALGNIAMLC